MKPNNLSSAVERARQGDRAAMAELYEATYPEVWRTVCSLIRDDGDAQDVLQETYLKAFQTLDQLNDSGSFQSWLRQIAANTARDSLRKKKPTLFTELSETEDLPFEAEDDRTEALPEARLDQRETTRLVREMLDALSDVQRLVIGMYYYQDAPIKVIAEELNLSENTVKGHLRYGKKKIEKRVRELEKQGVKLYGLTPLLFFRVLFKEGAVPAPKTVSDLSGKIAKQGVRALRRSPKAVLAGRIAVAAAAALLVGGLAVGTAALLQSRAAYGDVRPTETVSLNETESVFPVPETESPETTAPVNLDGLGEPAPQEMVDQLSAWISDPYSWFSRALSSRYAFPSQVDLSQLFYDGVELTPDAGIPDDLLSTEAVRLRFPGLAEFDHAYQVLPRVEMDKVLQQYFGLTLDETCGRGLPIVYLPEYDCWLNFHGDTNMEMRQVREVRVRADGTVLLTYEGNRGSDCPCWTALLEPAADGWRFRSNLPGEWSTFESAGPAAILYADNTFWRSEQTDPDGTRTVRELRLDVDGQLYYREGDPNSEFSWMATGQWRLEGSLLHTEFFACDEDGAKLGAPDRAADYDCVPDGPEGMVLTQKTDVGFGTAKNGWRITWSWLPNEADDVEEIRAKDPGLASMLKCKGSFIDVILCLDVFADPKDLSLPSLLLSLADYRSALTAEEIAALTPLLPDGTDAANCLRVSQSEAEAAVQRWFGLSVTDFPSRGIYQIEGWPWYYICPEKRDAYDAEIQSAAFDWTSLTVTYLRINRTSKGETLCEAFLQKSNGAWHFVYNLPNE